MTVVPLTSAVLSHVPARHSGVAASATNTARQLGAVVGVAVLGAIVNAHLVGAVDRQFTGLFAPARDSVLQVLETGGNAGTISLNTIPAPYVAAFLDGLQIALLVAAALMVIAAVAAALVRDPAPLEEETA